MANASSPNTSNKSNANDASSDFAAFAVDPNQSRESDANGTLFDAPFDNKFRFRLIGKIIRRSGFGKVTLIFITLFLACAAIVSICDPQAGGFGNAIWYCFQVVTTIGFGDVSVTSPVSRAACMALSVMSIFFIAIVTGVVVSYCSETIRAHAPTSDNGSPISKQGAEAESRTHAIEVDDGLLEQLERLPELSPSELETVSERVMQSISK